jgi:carbonic anhydrase
VANPLLFQKTTKGEARIPILSDLLENNRKWAENVSAQDPDFFSKLASIQNPEYLWIGCSDSRVPANQITGLAPGEVFVHRNVANVVVHTDLNCLSVMQFAVDALKIKHVIVCGHYGCGGVKAALHNQSMGLIDNWLRHVQDVKEKHGPRFVEPYSQEDWAALCELNVVEQVLNVVKTTVIQAAWERGQKIAVHGWIYGLQDGLIHDLNISVSSPEHVNTVYRNAVAMLASRFSPSAQSSRS